MALFCVVLMLLLLCCVGDGKEKKEEGERGRKGETKDKRNEKDSRVVQTFSLPVCKMTGQRKGKGSDT